MHLRISILLTLIQIGHTLYDNPLIIGKCLNGQSIVKLKVSGTPSKICAPKCNVDQHCPSSLITAAKGRCIRVSKRDLCILGCTTAADCPHGAICYSTPQLGLCLYQKKTTTTSIESNGVISKSIGSSSKSSKSSSSSKYKYSTTANNRLNTKSKIPVEKTRTHCVDACSVFAYDGICEDGGNNKHASCEYGADCTDCGPREITKEFPSAIHRVQQYETLNGIAEKWGVRSGALQVWNRIGDPHLLEKNQNLVVTRKGHMEEEYKNLDMKSWSRAMRAAKAKALNKLIGTAQLNSLINMYDTTMLGDVDTSGKVPTVTCKIQTPTSLVLSPLAIIDKRKLSDMLELERIYGNPDMNSYGTDPYWWSPPDCKPTDTVAIVVPFRQRETFLPNLLNRLHPLLRKQKLRYRIFIIEQVDTKPFNRAKLLNVGSVEASKYIPNHVWWSYPNFKTALSSICYVFHDIDLIPTSDATPYSCSKNAHPHHLSVFVDTHGGKCVYSEIFGGVSSITAQQMITVNGYSNLYWGWGGEDDDMSARIRRGAGLKISRPVDCYKQAPHGFGGCSFEADCLDQVERMPLYRDVDIQGIGHYKMVGGSKDSINGGKSMNNRLLPQLIIADRRMHEEGLSTLEYRVVSTEHHGTYTRVKVEL